MRPDPGLWDEIGRPPRLPAAAIYGATVAVAVAAAAGRWARETTDAAVTAWHIWKPR